MSIQTSREPGKELIVHVNQLCDSNGCPCGQTMPLGFFIMVDGVLRFDGNEGWLMKYVTTEELTQLAAVGAELQKEVDDANN